MKKVQAKKSRPNRRPADLNRLLFTRFMLIVAAFILWIGGIGVRLVHLQVNHVVNIVAEVGWIAPKPPEHN